MDAFVGVKRRRLVIEDGSLCIVGLVGASGRFVFVQWFHSSKADGSSPEANDYALHLSAVTGLPLV
jgi:hypothetical protein